MDPASPRFQKKRADEGYSRGPATELKVFRKLKA